MQKLMGFVSRRDLWNDTILDKTLTRNLLFCSAVPKVVIGKCIKDVRCRPCTIGRDHAYMSNWETA